MTAVFTVRLGEHHELNIAWITIELFEVIDQVDDFIIGQSQAHGGVGQFKCSLTTLQNINARECFIT